MVSIKKKENNSTTAKNKNTSLAKYIENIKALEATLKSDFKGNLFYMSDGSFSAIDLLMYLVEKNQNVTHVTISTFAISQKAAAYFVKMMELRNIQFDILLDWRMNLKNPDLVKYLKVVCHSVGFANIHAKLTCLYGGDASVTVINSANYTHNKRYESGVITDDSEVCEMYVNKIREIIRNGIND